MPDESLEVLIKTTAGASGGKPAAVALNQTSDAAQRLQRIFESTKGDPGIAESLKGMARGTDDAQRAYEQWSQHLHEDFTRLAKGLDMKRLAAGKAAADRAGEGAAEPEAAARDAGPKRLGGRPMRGAEACAAEAKGLLPAAQSATSEAKMESAEESRPVTNAARAAAQNAAAAAKQLGSSGAFGDREQVALPAEAGETARANRGPAQALTQQDRDASWAEDRVDPAIKALLAEVAKMQDKHLNGLKQAVDVISGASQTVDGLVGLMKTAIAHHAQLQGEQIAMAQQMAAWARSTQIP
jgi:hypothetical protein